MLGGCSSESVILIERETVYSNTDRGKFAVNFTLRPVSERDTNPVVSLDALVAATSLELEHYTDNPEQWEFVSIHTHSVPKFETAYHIQYRRDWSEWIGVVVAADGFVLGRP